MISFTEDYFQDEVRDGFYVPSLMKCTWAAELEMLDALRTLLDRYHLRWYADFGTLLGAVRHGGFIPWDDDIDLTMPRKDYMELLSRADELPDPFRILSIYTSEDFGQFHAVMSNSRAKKLEWDESRMERFHGCPFIVNLDIYPLDYIPADSERRKLLRLLYTMAYNLSGGGSEPDRSSVNQLSEYLEQFFGNRIRLDPNVSIKKAMALAADQIAMDCPEGEAEEVDYFAHLAFLESPLLRRKDWYRETVLLPFETTEIQVPGCYTAVLKKRFGEGYMRAVHEGAAHGYPFYEKQVEYFRFLGYLPKR